MNYLKDSKQLITNREIEVLNFISLGFTMSEIAKTLYISEHTVTTHRRNLIHKLKAKNTADSIRKAFEHGYLRFHSQAS